MRHQPKRYNLNRLYSEIQDVILSKQDPVTGLLPASTAINSHGNYTDAWVRDNVYSIIAPWALSMALKKAGDSIRSDELEQSTVKLMRGLLQSMMRQAHKVEAFKRSFNPLDALHAKYDTHTGLSVVADDAWGHLQIDATSVYLLMLAQMSSSGLRIIKTYSEVDFVQNLIYYIGSAFRIPDYGIWERGNKINNGNTEINASSLGMAKAALQALDGLNLFGEKGSARAVVHSLPDAISLARTNLASLLPRESLSKEVDSALLSVIGFPAFAVSDPKLITHTRDIILKKLGGNYGLKRFLWDGHQTEIEDPSRLYYEHSELANFEHIESEWPLFFCYLYLNALFEENSNTADYYREKIESLCVDRNGLQLIPELYFVPKDKIAAEKEEPGSQSRKPNENLPLVWAQSLFYTGLLLDQAYLAPQDLDACELRSTTTQTTQAQVALVILAENEQVKATLAKNGVIAESIKDIEPLAVISAPHLVEAYSMVGANSQLQLTGRPKRRLLSLSTSQTYTINDQRCLCLSWIQGVQTNDYSLRDVELVTRIVSREISHIRKHWLNTEVAVFTFMVNENLCTSPSASTLFKCLQNYQLRTTYVNTGYASASLAFLASRNNRLHIPSLCITPLKPLDRKPEDSEVLPEHVQRFLDRLDSGQEQQYQIITEYFSHHISIGFPENSLEDDASRILDTVYNTAISREEWMITRLCFALKGYCKYDLADYLSVLSARHFSVIVGDHPTCEFGLNPSLNNGEIIDVLKDASRSPIEFCILQELLEYVGILQRTQPEIFDGLRSIQLHNLLRLAVKHPPQKTINETIFEVAKLSPHRLLDRLDSIFKSTNNQFDDNLRSESLPHEKNNDEQHYMAVNMDWLEWRYERGLITSLGRDFLEDVWQSLSLAPQLIFGDSRNPDCIIDSRRVRNSMTSGEEFFAKLIDNALSQLHPPYFKTAMVEVLIAITEFYKQHTDKVFPQAINLETVLEQAASLYSEYEYQATPTSRNIDLLLEESPDTVGRYLQMALKNTAQ